MIYLFICLNRKIYMQTSRLYTKALCGEEEMGGKRKVALSPVQGPALCPGMHWHKGARRASLCYAQSRNSEWLLGND